MTTVITVIKFVYRRKSIIEKKKEKEKKKQTNKLGLSKIFVR